MQQELQPTLARWSFGKKLSFLFFMLFFPLYIFFNPNGVVPNTENIFLFYIDPFHQLIPWIGKHILHLPYDITIFTNGSGDTTYDYVVVLFIFVLSLVCALIWAVLDRKRPSYNQLYHWLTVVIRYYAAITMFSYGFYNDTVPPLQSDSTRWKQLIVSGYRDNSFAMLRGMNDSTLFHV